VRKRKRKRGRRREREEQKEGARNRGKDEVSNFEQLLCLRRYVEMTFIYQI